MVNKHKSRARHTCQLYFARSIYILKGSGIPYCQVAFPGDLIPASLHIETVRLNIYLPYSKNTWLPKHTSFWIPWILCVCVITSIALFPPLYNVMLIFFHRTENNEKLQLKSLIGHRKKGKKNPKCKPDNCIERALFQQLCFNTHFTRNHSIANSKCWNQRWDRAVA